MAAKKREIQDINHYLYENEKKKIKFSRSRSLAAILDYMLKIAQNSGFLHLASFKILLDS